MNPLLTAVILVVVHFSEMQVINFGTLEPNLMDIQPLTVHMNTAKMATFTLVVGKSSGSKLTWPIWIKELLLLKVAALATSVMRTGSILTILTMTTTMATTMVVMATTMVVMTATMAVTTATMVVMTATMVVMTATMVATTEIAMKLSKPLSKKLKKLLLKPKIYFKVLKALLTAFAPTRLILISSMRKLRKHAIKLLKQ